MAEPLTYTCEGCGKTFTGTPEEAFELGWDTPERFMSHCTCGECPITTTLWWRLVLWQQEHPDEAIPATPEEVALLQGYQQIFEASVASERSN